MSLWKRVECLKGLIAKKKVDSGKDHPRACLGLVKPNQNGLRTVKHLIGSLVYTGLKRENTIGLLK